METTSTYLDGDVKLEVNVRQVRLLEGKLLTIVDGAFADPEQRKAVKDMVRERLWDWTYWNMPKSSGTNTNSYTIATTN